MKIGIDCRLINKTQNTGISRYTEFLIEYYIKSFGFENVFLITNDKMFTCGKCKVFYTTFKPYNIFHFFYFSIFLKKIKLDLFHVPFYSGLFRRNKKLKVIVTVHDLMYRFVDGFFGKNMILSRLKIIYFDFIIKKTLLNSDIIVSVSLTTKEDLYEIFGFDSIHIPEDSSIDEIDDFSILERFGLLHKEFYLYCGNNRPHKNIDFIVDIFNKNLDLPRLVLVGKHHCDSENVIATGLISDLHLNALYKSAIAFVFPSEYEGFGLPVLEAIRSETFVVASKIPAFMEFKTKNIFFFELGNKEDFLEALKKTLSNNFIVDIDFLNYYDKKKIHELNDVMIKNLFKAN